MNINDLSYLENISEAISIKGGKQSTIINVYQNAYAMVNSAGSNVIGSPALAMNIAIINIKNILTKRIS
jgi:hypothetical protein